MKKTVPHVALLPSPGMGHIIPMVEFAKKLILLKHNQLSLTLLIPADSTLRSNGDLSSLGSLPKGINIVQLPRPDFDDLRQDEEIAVIVSTIERSLSCIRQVIGSLAQTANLVALVVDFLGTAAFSVANEFNVSPYLFFPSTARLLSLILYLPKLDAAVSCPYRDLPGPVPVPGCAPVRAGDLLEPFQDRESLEYKFFVNEGKKYAELEGIVVNTFSDIEGGAIKALKQENYPPVYPVGPLVRPADTTDTTDAGAVAVMKWLDDKPDGSVLYISFGSLGLLSCAQILELAFGLELSEKGFIWVVRSPNGDPSSLLPDDFLQRTKGRGLVVTNWAPQMQILGHGSTGGFLTHCGWNSVLESIVNGVPMIAWPLQSDQKMNAAMLMEDLNIALRVEANNDDHEGLVGRIEIANSVKDLMEGERGKELRQRTRAFMDAAKMAVSDDGSSTKFLADLVCLWEEKQNSRLNY